MCQTLSSKGATHCPPAPPPHPYPLYLPGAFAKGQVRGTEYLPLSQAGRELLWERKVRPGREKGCRRLALSLQDNSSLMSLTAGPDSEACQRASRLWSILLMKLVLSKTSGFISAPGERRGWEGSVCVCSTSFTAK